MYAITERAKKAILDRRAQRLKLTISNAENVITISEANIQSGGFSIDRHSTSSNKLALGSASAADLELSLANLNGEFDDFKFEGAEMRPEVIIDSREYSVMSEAGNNVTIEDSEDEPLAGLTIYGKTTQNGIPTQDDPIPLENVGDDGVMAKVEGANLLDSRKISKSNINGISIEYLKDEGCFLINGTATHTNVRSQTPINIPLKKHTLYRITNSYVSGTVTRPSGNEYALTYVAYNRTGATSANWISCNLNMSDAEISGYSYDATTLTYFWFYIDAGVSFNNYKVRVMIYKSDVSLPYQPYKEPQQLITTTPNGLCGIPVSSGGNYTDSNGKQWICDEIDFERGVLIKRTHTQTFVGAEPFSELGGSGDKNAFFYVVDSSVNPLTVNNEGFSLCSHYEPKLIVTSTSDIGHQVRKVSTGTQCRILFRPDNVENMTAASFQAWLKKNPTTVTYALATPIETALPISDISSFNEIHTLEGTTIIESKGDISVKYLVSGDRDDKVGTKTFTFVFPMGYFTVDNQPRKLSTIKITALDRMVLFDKTVDWSILSFPMSVSSLVTQICNVCNVSLYELPTSLVNSGYTVQKPSINGDLTYRQLLMYCAEILACCAFIDENGLLRLSWYSQTEDDTIDITERYSSDINENDITISGVVITYDDVEYIAGSTDYAILLQSNPLITHDVQEVAENIYSAIKGTTYRPYECSSMPLTYLYPLDCISLIDEDENKIKTLVTHVNFTLNNALSLKGVGETSQNNGYATVNPLTMQESAIIERLLGEVNKTMNDRIQTIIGFNELITNSMGLFSTTITKENGSRQTFMHDAPTLEQSMTIYTMTEYGFAYTNSGWNDGNPSYQYGFDKFGNAIFNKVCAYGIEVSDPNTKYSAKINPEAFETYFGAMLTSSFNGELSRVSKMKIIESFQTGKSLLVPHYEEDEATGKPNLIGTDLVFLEEE